MSFPPKGLLQNLCSPEGSEEEGKGYLGSEGLGQGTLSMGALLLSIQLWSGPVSLCSKQDSPKEQRAQKGLWPSQRMTTVAILSKHFNGHLESFHYD